MGQTGRALIVGFLLQSVTVVVTTHRELPVSVFLLLGNDLGYPMVRHNPHRMLMVFQDRAHAGSEETMCHVQQPYLLGFLVVHRCSGCRPLPDEST